MKAATLSARCRVSAGAIDRSLFLPVLESLRILVYPILLFGLWKVFARPIGFLHWFSLSYVALVLCWPFHPWQDSGAWRSFAPAFRVLSGDKLSWLPWSSPPVAP